MKVTIDLDRLLEEGKISQAEHAKFSEFAARGTSQLVFNILVGFGVVAVSGGILALLPTTVTAITLGLTICAAGLVLMSARIEQWTLLANICILVGALLLGAGVIKTGEGSVGSFLLVSAAFAAAGIISRSSLLSVLAVLSLSSCLGTRTGYLHATYFLGVQEPAATTAVFIIFSFVTYKLSKHLSTDYERLAIVASRAGVFLVNFGFWIGSLWGDHIGGGVTISAQFFALLWAIGLIAVGAWAWHRNLRWLINVVATFGAIHFYTQWFERLGASAETVLLAGLLALGFAVALRNLNLKLSKAT